MVISLLPLNSASVERNHNKFASSTEIVQSDKNKLMNPTEFPPTYVHYISRHLCYVNIYKQNIVTSFRHHKSFSKLLLA